MIEGGACLEREGIELSAPMMILFPSLVTANFIDYIAHIRGLGPIREGKGVASTLRFLTCAVTGKGLVGSLVGATVARGRSNCFTALDVGAGASIFGGTEDPLVSAAWRPEISGRAKADCLSRHKSDYR